MMRSLLVFSLLLVALPAAAGTKVMGIDSSWDMEETKRQFAKAGVGSATNLGLAKFLAEGRARGLADGLGDQYFGDVPHFNRLRTPECLFFENGLHRRHDIAVVAVCFADKKYQLFVLPFFLKREVDADTLRRYLNEIYGQPQEENMWVDSAINPKRHIKLIDYSDMPYREGDPGFSAAIFYVNNDQCTGYIAAVRREINEIIRQGL